MPFTPLHLGIGACCKAVAPQRFSFMIFGGTQVLMDIEPLLGMIYGWQDLHIMTHNIIGATLIGASATLLGKPISQWLLRALPYHNWKISWRTALLSAFIGSYSHIVLDAFMHHDVFFFYPWQLNNPFANWLSYTVLFYGCVTAILLGGLACWFRLKTQNKQPDTTEIK